MQDGHLKSNAGLSLKVRWKGLVDEEEVVSSYLITLRKNDIGNLTWASSVH
jgi:hypothetical protein